ncbi:MAG: hypothetical protein AAF570_25680, partial [Bacteroidota bacterium]
AFLAWQLTHALHKRQRDDRAGAHVHYQAVIQRWQAEPRRITQSPERYIKAAAAYMYSCHAAGAYSELQAYLATLRDHPTLQAGLRRNLLLMLENIQLLYAMNRDAPAVETAQHLADLLSEHEGTFQLSYALPATLNLGIYHLLKSDLGAARKWFHRIAVLPRGTERIDIRELARLLHLVCLYGLQEDELLPYFQKATERFIRKRRTFNPLERALFRCFRMYAKQPTRARKWHNALHTQLADLRTQGQWPGLEEVWRWLSESE